MKIIEATNFQLNKDSAVTIGKFDGIHRGHRELLDRIIEKKKQGLQTVVFTFDKSPAEFFSGKLIPSLTTKEEKRRIFEFLGVDVLIEYPLTKESAAISPEDFVNEILCKQIRAKYIAAGTDLSFAHMGKGDATLLKVMAYEDYNCIMNCGIDNKNEKRYEVDIIDKINIDGEEVSSSLIRNVVAAGDMEKANKLIGVPYAVSGYVEHGRELGRKMGFPTVNLKISNEKLVPPYGVYYTEVSVEGIHYNGITNIGSKPTVTDSRQVFAETNILDFDDDVYGKRITVKLLKFARPEQKFSSVDELRARIAIDIQNGKEFFAKKI